MTNKQDWWIEGWGIAIAAVATLAVSLRLARAFGS